MRRTLVFLGVLFAVLLAVMAFDRVVDPANFFYDGTPLRVAESSRPQCLVSDDLVGSVQWLRFKEQLFQLRRPRTVVVGSSRVLKIGEHPGEARFANLGLPQTSPKTVLDLFRLIAREAPGRKLTVYLGVELFWFNPSSFGIAHPPFDVSLRQRLEYLLSRVTFEDAVRLARSSPRVAFHRWRREQTNGYCILDRQSASIAWKPDGTRLYDFELHPGGAHPPSNGSPSDLIHFRGGIFGSWHSFDRARLAQLEEALALAHAKGWRVVGFSPPDSTRYARFLEASPAVGPFWHTFFRTVPAAFRREGFSFLDLHDVRLVPCRQTDFVDDGYHVNARCAARIRARLDAAAR
jgi:hypothetical protein